MDVAGGKPAIGGVPRRPVDAVPEPQTILGLLAAQKERRGSVPAILGPDGDSLSYDALYGEIERLGSLFASMGLGRGSRIGVSLPNTPEAAVTMLAAMVWASAAPLGVGLAFDDCVDLLARLRIDAAIVADAESSSLLEAADAAGLPLLRLRAGHPASVVALSRTAKRAAAPRIPPRLDDVAVLMQTSGTAGRPKIVPITHAQLLWNAQQPPIDEHDRYLAVGSIFSSTGLAHAVLSPLAAGAATVIAGDYDSARFVDWLDTFKPTCLSSSPTILASVLDAVTERPPAAPQSLRFVRSGSNALPAAIESRLEAALRVPVIQGYGMTETGFIAQNPLPPRERRAGSVGVALGTELKILRDDAQSALDADIGEILVRGPGITSGYENDDDANRLAFRDGWFRTGDLGWIDEDGYLFITGRASELINRGGVKVSPSEVDLAFMQHPAVLDAATFAVPHPSLGEDVVTAIVLREAGSASVQSLRSHALARLLPFKVPSSLVLVDGIPRNAMGKVSRSALADTFSTALQIDYVEPRDGDEALIAAIFAEHFGVPRVGALDHFFRLGGDSLHAAQVLVTLSDRCGVEIALQALFESPTVAELADQLRAARATPKSRQPGPIPVSGRRAAPDTAAADAPTAPDSVL